MGFEVVKEKALNKPKLGALKKAGVPPVRFVKEFRYPGISEQFQVGQEVNVTDVFQDGELVDVIGVSRGRGFAGGVRRWGFAGGPKTHGSRGWHRRIGSIGNRTYPGEVKPGKKMPGQYGNEQVTVRNLKIVKIIPEQNIIAVKGSVPGSKNGFVLVRKAYGLGPQGRSE
jgi:large subunit ribosomal protein L3